MIKNLYKFCVLSWLFICLFSVSAYADKTTKSNAKPCSAEQLQKIENDLEKAAVEGLKNSKILLDTYNKIAGQYIADCNPNPKTGTSVHWNSDTVAAAFAVDQNAANTLMSNPEAYRYTGIIWSAENPTNQQCNILRQQADMALQNFNKSRVTTTALVSRAGGRDVPRSCVCSENADNQECVAYLTKDEEPKKATDGCKMFSEYMAEFATCPLCPIFEVILNTDSKVAHVAWINLAKPLRGVVIAFFLVFIAIETLKLISSMGGASTSSYLKTLFALGFKVAIVLILLQNSTYVYNYFISPVIRGGLEMGQEFVKIGSYDAANATGCKMSDSSMTFGSVEGNELDSSILSNIYETVRCFNNSALELPAIGKALMCHGWENGGKWPDLEMWIAGALNYIFGLMIWLSISFYLIDCTVQLGMICALVPMFIACWPFKMTQRYTYTGVKVIMNTFFNFVLMGIVILVGIELVNFALQTGNNNIEGAALISSLNNIDINVEKLKKLVNLDSGTILGLVACCIMAMKLIATANSAAAKFSSSAGSDIGAKMGGLANSAGTKLATGVGSAGLHAAGATAKALGQKVANTDTGNWVKNKYRAGKNIILGRPKPQTGSGLPDEENKQEIPDIENPETTHSQNSNPDTSETTQKQQQNSQTTNPDENPVYANGQPKFSETTDENGNTNRKNFDENGNVTSETKTDKNGNEVEYKGYHANGELAAHHTVDENGTRHWQTFNEDKTLRTEGSYNEKTGDSTEKKYDHGQLTSERTDSGNGDYSYKTYHSNGKTKQEGKGNINTGGHHISYDEEQNVTRKWHTFEKGQTDE